MKSVSASHGQTKAILLRIIALQLRLAWDDIVQQELPPSLQRLLRQLDSFTTKLVGLCGTAGVGVSFAVAFR
jgi:hypothetical protein